MPTILRKKLFPVRNQTRGQTDTQSVFTTFHCSNFLNTCKLHTTHSHIVIYRVEAERQDSVSDNEINTGMSGDKSKQAGETTPNVKTEATGKH